MKKDQYLLLLFTSLLIIWLFTVAVFNNNVFALEHEKSQFNSQIMTEIESLSAESTNVNKTNEDITQIRATTDQDTVKSILEQRVFKADLSDSQIDIGEIARLRRELIKLDLEYQKVVLESKIANIQNSDSTLSTSESEDFTSKIISIFQELDKQKELNDVSEGEFKETTLLPVVAEIIGIAGQLQAKILVPYFGEVIAHSGTILPNGMTVTSITETEVIAIFNNESQMLPFGSSVPISRIKE